MKKFDLEAAKAGAEVCTRDGRPAKILLIEKDMITAAIYSKSGRSIIVPYYHNGFFNKNMVTESFDLMMAEIKEFVPFNYRSDDVISREGVSTSASTIEINE